MLEQLFKFPIVMIDADNEERKYKDKNKFGDLPGGEDDEEGDYDMIFGEAEYPYWDLVGIEDRWLPNRDSMDRAMNDGVFDACIVRFLNVGQMLVPWTRKKFKASLIKFAEDYKLSQPEQKVMIKTISQEQFKKLTDE